MNIVIGSGPAGVACAHALHARGEEILMLDAGLTREAGHQDLLNRIRQNDALALRELVALHESPPLSNKGVVKKLIHGSDFPYREAVEHFGFEGSETGLLPSLARGGLSNVWGAAVLPYRAHDMVDWPIGHGELSAHYEAVLRITGLAAIEDDLAELFPLFHEASYQLDLSAQASRVLEGLKELRGVLRGDGITFGHSRLTVGPNLAQGAVCVYCGRCLHGCPYGCIYNSAADIDWLQMQREGRFTYHPDCIVEKLAEFGDAVVVHGLDRVTREPVRFDAERVFVAAGVIPSARIMLKTFDAYEQPVELKDSQYFVLPLISSWSGGNVSREALHTLSQLFIEIQDEDISSYTVHLQLYTYNDIIGMMLRKKLWFAPGLREFLIGPFRERVLVIQGYLHSAESGTISLKLTRDAWSGREALVVGSQAIVHTREVVARVIRKLKRHLSKLGIFPVPGGLEITQPGRGFHSGGSFPMRHRPTTWESDTLGRLSGFKRVHLADASTFPSIPATTITLTAMANAHRIGTHFDS